MGLCKCPKRRVTNLFCFEHRVNVCEHCLISKHSKCIVQSYLQWLQDSDYNPNCRLCNTPLAADDTVRLVCYDLFHWTCVNEMALRLPTNTAPAGYQCPSCSGPIFPPANLVSPVASVLKERLSTVNWARAGLGLPLIEEGDSLRDQDSLDDTDWSSFSVGDAVDHGARCQEPAVSGAYTSLQQCGHDGETGTVAARPPDHSAEAHSLTTAPAPAPRRVYDPVGRDPAPPTALQMDFDDDKYRRRPALSWLARLLSSAPGRKGKRGAGLSRPHRLCAAILLGVLAFLTVIVVMSRLSRDGSDNDPNWDPLQNPHIQVGAE